MPSASTNASGTPQRPNGDQPLEPDVDGNVPVWPDQILSALTGRLRAALRIAIGEKEIQCLNVFYYNPRMHATLHFMPLPIERERTSTERLTRSGYYQKLCDILGTSQILATADIDDILAYAVACPQARSAASRLKRAFKLDGEKAVIRHLLKSFAPRQLDSISDSDLPTAAHCLLSFLPQPTGLKHTLLSKATEPISRKGPDDKIATWEDAVKERSGAYKLYLLLSIVESLQWAETEHFVLIPSIFAFLEHHRATVCTSLHYKAALFDEAFHCQSIPLRHCGLYYTYTPRSYSKASAEDKTEGKPAVALFHHMDALGHLAHDVALAGTEVLHDTGMDGPTLLPHYVALGLSSLLPAEAACVLSPTPGGMAYSTWARLGEDDIEKRRQALILPSYCLPTADLPWGVFRETAGAITAEESERLHRRMQYTECSVDDMELLVGEEALGAGAGGVKLEPLPESEVWSDLDDDSGGGRGYLGRVVAGLIASAKRDPGPPSAESVTVAAEEWYRNWSWRAYEKFSGFRCDELARFDWSLTDSRLNTYKGYLARGLRGSAPGADVKIGDFGSGLAHSVSALKRELEDSERIRARIVELYWGGDALRDGYDDFQPWDWDADRPAHSGFAAVLAAFGRTGIFGRNENANVALVEQLLKLSLIHISEPTRPY